MPVPPAPLNELLRRYAEERDEPAFAEIVERTVNLVHSAALRQTYGDSQLAQEVTQAVYLDLARKARLLVRHTALTGWLYTSTRFAATKALRAQQRWRERNREAQAMHDTPDPSAPDPEWHHLRYVLDAAMGELGARDREALLLRYFEDRPLAEVGARIGLSENSARMRVDRALDKLRDVLARRGITSSAAALALLLAQQGVSAAPAGLAATAASAAIAGSAAGGAAATLTLAKVLLGLAGAAAVAGVVAVWSQSQAPVTPTPTTIAAPAGGGVGAAAGGRGGAPRGTVRAGATVTNAMPIPGPAAPIGGGGRARGGGGGGGARGAAVPPAPGNGTAGNP